MSLFPDGCGWYPPMHANVALPTITVLVRFCPRKTPQNSQRPWWSTIFMYTDTLVYRHTWKSFVAKYVNHQLEFKRSAFMYTWCCLCQVSKAFSDPWQKIPSARIGGLPGGFLPVKVIYLFHAHLCLMLPENWRLTCFWSPCRWTGQRQAGLSRIPGGRDHGTATVITCWYSRCIRHVSHPGYHS